MMLDVYRVDKSGKEIRKGKAELALGQQFSKAKGGLFKMGGGISLKRHIQFLVILYMGRKLYPFQPTSHRN